MSITSDMRRAWHPPCTGPLTRLNLHGSGVITVRTAAVPAFRALNAILIKYNYITRRQDTGAYNCRKITGGNNYSLHAYGIAADLNWQTNPYGPNLVTDMPIEMVQEIEALHTNSGHRVFRWGGRYSRNKDAMHYEVICSPEQLATGVAQGTIAPPEPPTTPPPPPPPPPPPSQDSETIAGVADMYIAVSGIGFFAQFGNSTVPLEGIDLAGFGALQKAADCPTLIIPAGEPAKDFMRKAFLQTAHATGQA